MLTRLEKRAKRRGIVQVINEIEELHCMSCPIFSESSDECLACPLQKEFGVLGEALMTVSHREQNVEKRIKNKQKRFNVEVSAYIELKKDFYSEYQIAEKWGITETTLQNWRKRNGLEGKNWHKYI